MLRESVLEVEVTAMFEADLVVMDLVLSPSTRGSLIFTRRRQVSWLADHALDARLPGISQWLVDASSPLTVAGAAVALTSCLTTFPQGPNRHQRQSHYSLNGRPGNHLRRIDTRAAAGLLTFQTVLSGNGTG